MKKPLTWAWHPAMPMVRTGLLVLLFFTLAACSLGPTTGGGTPTPTISPTPMPPATTFGPQPCPGAAKDTSHWNSIVEVSGGQKVESVSCGNLLGNSSLQALVTVRHPGNDNLLDVYVYNNINAAQPTQLFKLQGLNHGNAKISNYDTVITAEADTNSSINKGQPPSKVTVDLFREFRGLDWTTTYTQVTFPGIYPDLTRWQAEAAQNAVNKGQDSCPRLAL